METLAFSVRRREGKRQRERERICQDLQVWEPDAKSGTLTEDTTITNQSSSWLWTKEIGGLSRHGYADSNIITKCLEYQIPPHPPISTQEMILKPLRALMDNTILLCEVNIVFPFHVTDLLWILIYTKMKKYIIFCFACFLLLSFFFFFFVGVSTLVMI